MKWHKKENIFSYSRTGFCFKKFLVLRRQPLWRLLDIITYSPSTLNSKARALENLIARLSQSLYTYTPYDVGTDSQELNFKVLYLVLRSLGSTVPTSYGVQRLLLNITNIRGKPIIFHLATISDYFLFIVLWFPKCMPVSGLRDFKWRYYGIWRKFWRYYGIGDPCKPPPNWTKEQLLIQKS